MDSPVRRRARWSIIAAVPIAFALVLGGCATAPLVRTDVTAFHQWQQAEPLTFSFRRTPAQQQSLEHLEYEAQVADRMQALGFQPAPADVARYQVGIQHSTTTHVQRRTEYPFHPYHPPMAGWAYPRFGYGGALMYADPWFWGPPLPLVREVPVGVHTFRVEIYDTRAPQPEPRRVFEASARASAAQGSLPEVVPALVAAVFTDFPGASGKTRRIDVALPAGS
jgi:hypothetical protein